jgi:hypothetical protein
MTTVIGYAETDSYVPVEPPTIDIEANRGEPGGTAAETIVPKPKIEDDKDIFVIFVGTAVTGAVCTIDAEQTPEWSLECL